jgi:hypothetical protein
MIKTLSLCATTVLAFLAFSTQADALCVAPKKLSNKYKANDGGTYFVRRVGNTVWWLGRSSDGGQSWTNVFKGTLNGNTFSGEWSDVAGRNSGHGTLTLQIQGSIETGVHGFRRIGGTGSGFGGERWSIPCNDT